MLESTSSMHRANLTIITIPILLLAATVAISVTVSEDAFARERYSGDSTSQAASVNNECLNPILDSNNVDNAVGVGNCGGTISQQEESGQASAPITHQTANPTIEVQRSTTTQPPLTGTPPSVEGCEECFDMLTDAQKEDFVSLLPDRFSGITTLEELCMLLINTVQSGGDFESMLSQIESILGLPDLGGSGVSSDVITDIMNCVQRNIF